MAYVDTDLENKKIDALEKRKVRHTEKVEILKKERENLFQRYKIYLEILENLGNGLMLKKQHYKFVHIFTAIGESKYSKSLKELVDVGLVARERTNGDSILVVTKPARALLQKKDVSKVSVSRVWNNRNFKKSALLSEYMLSYLIPRFNLSNSFENFMDVVNTNTNLYKKSGDNVAITEILLKKQSLSGTISNTNTAFLGEDLEYIKASASNRGVNLKNQEESKKKEFVPIYKDKNKPSINNLQARNMYIISTRNKLKVVYLETGSLINFTKFTRDMQVLSKYGFGAGIEKIFLEVVVETKRLKDVQKVVSVWERKKKSSFYMPDGLNLCVVGLDITEQYLKGSSLSIY